MVESVHQGIPVDIFKIIIIIVEIHDHDDDYANIMTVKFVKSMAILNTFT